MEAFKESFLNYLQYEKRYSQHTILSYSVDLQQFIDFVAESQADFDIKNTNYLLVRTWIVRLSEENCVPRTINRKITCLKSFFKHLMRENKIDTNPMLRIKSLKIQKRLPVFIEENNLDVLLKTIVFEDNFAGIRDKLILELLYATGIRLSEMLQLKNSDVNLYDQMITVLGKGNKQRKIPLHKNAIEAIKKYNLIKNITFENVTENTFLITDNGQPMYAVFVQRIVKKYLNKVSNADKKSPHVLRHSFATHMLDHGANINSIKEILGHSSLAATQIYTHNSMEKLKKIFDQAHPKA